VLPNKKNKNNRNLFSKIIKKRNYKREFLKSNNFNRRCLATKKGKRERAQKMGASSKSLYYFLHLGSLFLLFH
jgi:hypothetical protein